MAREIETLAHFAAEARWQDAPESVQHQTKMVLLDTLGVILAGSERPEVFQLRARLTSGNTGPATVFARDWPGSDTRTAALLNGIAGRSIEMCEGLRLATGQVAMQVLPGILAVGEQARSSGLELLTSLLLGYEVGARFCLAFTPHPLAHQNGQASLLGAVAASACLSKLGTEGMSLAMRVATTMLLTPSYTNAIAGATNLNVAGGMSGFAAALAPDLVMAGFEAQEDAIEEALGSLVGAGFNSDGLTEALGDRWEITRNYFRLYACCNPVHPALDCLKELIASLHPGPEEIDRIEVSTYRFASLMRDPEPRNYFASKYSLPHAAAAMIVNGNAGYASLDDAALRDPVIRSLRHRVFVTEDPAMTAVAPRLRPARVSMTLKDGRSATFSCESHRGDFNQPFTEAELRDKFRELATETLVPEGVNAVEQAIDRCETWRQIGELTMLTRRYGRPPKRPARFVDAKDLP